MNLNGEMIQSVFRYIRLRMSSSEKIMFLDEIEHELIGEIYDTKD